MSNDADALEKQLTAEILERVRRIAQLRGEEETEFDPGTPR